MTHSRRTTRSRRVLTASALLATAVLVAAAGIVVSTIPFLIGATAYAVFTGIVSARLLANDLAQMRRDWARDRAHIADSHRLQAVVRSQEHTAYVEQLGSRIRLKDAQLETLRDALVTAEIDLAKARERASAERARVEALTADLTSAESDIESARRDLLKATDALASSEAAETQARAAALAWEQAATEEERRQHRLNQRTA